MSAPAWELFATASTLAVRICRATVVATDVLAAVVVPDPLLTDVVATEVVWVDVVAAAVWYAVPLADDISDTEPLGLIERPIGSGVI